MLSLYFLKVCINTLEKDMVDGKYKDYNKIFIKTKNIITGEYASIVIRGYLGLNSQIKRHILCFN